jgi:hypothetical protein
MGDEGKLISVSARLARQIQARVLRVANQGRKFAVSSSPYLLSDYIFLDAVKLPPHFGFAAFHKTADE